MAVVYLLPTFLYSYQMNEYIYNYFGDVLSSYMMVCKNNDIYLKISNHSSVILTIYLVLGHCNWSQSQRSFVKRWGQPCTGC